MQNKQLHTSILGKLLYAFYTNEILRQSLIFKGGTACYLLYNLPRFSTDLDFNIMQKADIDSVYQELQTACSSLVNIKDAHKKRNTLFLLTSYKEESWNIKIEVNTRHFPNDRYELTQYLGLPLNILKKEYIVAHKLVALTDRPHTVMRDIFDAHYFLKNDWPIDEATIQYRTGKNAIEYYKYLISFIEAKQPIDILQGVGELLDHHQKEWVKKHVVEELLFLLKLKTNGATHEN